jgi:hypothetical protein
VKGNGQLMTPLGILNLSYSHPAAKIVTGMLVRAASAVYLDGWKHSRPKTEAQANLAPTSRAVFRAIAPGA